MAAPAACWAAIDEDARAAGLAGGADGGKDVGAGRLDPEEGLDIGFGTDGVTEVAGELDPVLPLMLAACCAACLHLSDSESL